MRPMVGFRDMAKFVGNHMLDSVNRRLNKAAVQKETARWRHGSPALSERLDRQPRRPRRFGIGEPLQIQLKALSEFDMRARSRGVLSDGGEERGRSTFEQGLQPMTNACPR